MAHGWTRTKTPGDEEKPLHHLFLPCSSLTWCRKISCLDLPSPLSPFYLPAYSSPQPLSDSFCMSGFPQLVPS